MIDPVRSPGYAPVMGDGEGTVERVSERGESRTYFVTAPKAGFLRTDWLFFPGAAAEVDGETAPIRCGKNGFVEVRVRKGAHTVTVLYMGTALERFADAMSIAGFILTAGIILVSSKTRRNRKDDFCPRPTRGSDPPRPRQDERRDIRDIV